MKNVYLIPTDKTSRIHLGNSGLVLCDLNFSSDTINGQHLYITNSEEITGFENNIWVIKGDRIFLWQNTMALVSDNKPKKIILTTDAQLIKDDVQAIDDEFLEWFIKNPSCEIVDVNLVPVNEFGSEITVGGYGFNKFIYKIIIPKEESIQFVCEHLEEVGCIKDVCTCNTGPKKETVEELAIENRIRGINVDTGFRIKRSYSEEEVLDILFHWSMYKASIEIDKLADGFINILPYNEWFEQFKKKYLYP